MRILILGSGAREHAISWKLSKSNRITGLFIAPGNAGTAEVGENLSDVNPENAVQVIEVCKNHRIDYVFVGPEAPLAAGVIDQLQANGIACFGPHQAAAQLEASKVFSKQFMIRHKIPTAQAVELDSVKDFENYLKKVKGKAVIKKSGLASGKGVFESDDKAALLAFGKETLKDDKILVEEFLTGYEISIFTLTDGKNFVMLPPCADFKKAFEGDCGPNTGGMGAICPVPVVSSTLLETIKTKVVAPTFKGMAKEGLSFKGILYFGLMITSKGPKLLEYNVRFGDPETQALLPLIDCDFGNLLESIEAQTLDQFEIPIKEAYSLGVVVAAEGYPGKYKKNCVVEHLPSNLQNKRVIFHASTLLESNQVIKTNGGRCFTVVGMGSNFGDASTAAYSGVKEVAFDGAWFRKDIGAKFIKEELLR